MDGAASASANSVSISSHWHAGHQVDPPPPPPPPAPVETKRPVKVARCISHDLNYELNVGVGVATTGA
eukprot:14207796-Alexandrium_andersonii.AAC.1